VIPCPVCGYTNPLGTRFCRSCGGKLDVKMAQVVGSIQDLKNQNRADAVSRMGRSIFSLSVFALIFVLVVRVMVIPPIPIAELPPAQIEQLIPAENPSSSTALPLNEFKRLPWRRDNAMALLGGVGIDTVQLQNWQNAIAAAQRPDGSFSGEDELAATGLMALALQAFPMDGRVVDAAARARSWLMPQMSDLTRRAPLGRSLGMAALVDADELPAGSLGSFSMYLVDGKAPIWQSLAISLFPPNARPADLILLRKALQGQLWTNLFEAIDGRMPSPLEARPYFSETAKVLNTGEARLVWAFVSWQLAAAPKDLTETMTLWSRSPPPPIDADTLAKCGPLAPSAVAVLTLATPARVPPLWLQPR
jgi:hypothetical protein